MMIIQDEYLAMFLMLDGYYKHLLDFDFTNTPLNGTKRPPKANL